MHLLILSSFLIVGLATASQFNQDNAEIKSWSHDITVASLLNGEELADGDTIVMTESEEACYSDYIQVELRLMSPLTWWKGVRLHTKADRGYWRAVSEIKETQTPVVAMFNAIDLYSNDLVLWKAKFLGSYTAVYRINDAAENMKPGHRYTIYWLKD